MPTLDWNKWADGWSAAFPKNRMWGKIRSTEHDENGNPLFRWPKKPNTSSMDPELADVLQAHRFVNPAVRSTDQDRHDEHCFCGWVGPHHGDHLVEKIEEFTGEPVETLSTADGEPVAKSDDKGENEGEDRSEDDEKEDKPEAKKDAPKKVVVKEDSDDK